jgi:hypothetical protein
MSIIIINNRFLHFKRWFNEIKQQLSFSLSLKPTIDEETEKVILGMFADIDAIYSKECIMSFRYILYKICQLLEMNDIIDAYCLMEHDRDVHEQDRAWYEVINKLNWSYMPSDNLNVKLYS